MNFKALNISRIFTPDYTAIVLKNNFELKTLLSVGGRNHNSTDWTRMAAADATIDSFIQNSMGFIRQHNFDGIDIDWQFPAFCESPERCSPVSDAARFKVLLEKFRDAIESENVSPADKMIISSSAGHKKNQIYDTGTKTTMTSMTEPAPPSNIVFGILEETEPTLQFSNESSTTTPSKTTGVLVVPNESPDMKIEIWAPIIGGILLVAIIILIVWRVKRANERVTINHLRSDRKARDPDADTIYENYASSDNCNNIQRNQESYYSQLYTAYDDEYTEYREPYAEYKEPKK